jgi:hypothetical protein
MKQLQFKSFFLQLLTLIYLKKKLQFNSIIEKKVKNQKKNVSQLELSLYR